MKLEELYKNYYERMHKNGIIPLLGMINGNKLLFVGQNPGVPFQKEHIELFAKFKELDYEKQQKIFKLSWNKSLFIQFIKRISINVGFAFDNDCGVTNIVKYWTSQNDKPEITTLDQETLRDEITICNPILTIFLSRFAFNNFLYKDMFKEKILVFSHPVTERYSKQYELLISEKIKERII